MTAIIEIGNLLAAFWGVGNSWVLTRNFVETHCSRAASAQTYAANHT
jgi:hypothetical protein